MIKHTKEGLVTDEAQALAAYLGKVVLLWQDREWIKGILDGDDLGWRKVCIPWPTVKAAIQPIEGEGYICVYRKTPDHEPLFVQPNYAHPEPQFAYFHKRVLNIVTTRAELRELIKHIEEAKG